MEHSHICVSDTRNRQRIIPPIFGAFFISKTHYLMVPSQLHVAILEVSCGCHSQPMTTPLCALILDSTRHDFQSQNHILPSESPLMTNRPSAEKLGWQA